MKKYLYILLALAIFVCLANAAAVAKPKTPEPEDSSEDDPKPSLGASTNATRSPKEGLGNGGDSRSGRPVGRGGAGSASNGAGDSSSNSAGGITIVRSGIRPTKSDSSPGEAAAEEKPQVPKNSTEQVSPKKPGGGASRNLSPTEAKDRAPGGASGNAPGEDVSANGRSVSGSGAKKDGSRRDSQDGGTGRPNNTSPAIIINKPGAKNSGSGASAPEQKPQQAPKSVTDPVPLPTPGGRPRAESATEDTAEGLEGGPANATAGAGRARATEGSGDGANTVGSRRNSNRAATRRQTSGPTGSSAIGSGSSQVSSDRSTGAAGGSVDKVRKPARSPLYGALGVDSGSSGRAGSNRRPGSGYASGVSSSSVFGIEDSFPTGLDAADSGVTSDDVLTGHRRGVFPAGLGDDAVGRIPTGRPLRGTPGSTASSFGHVSSGSAGRLSARLPSRASSGFEEGFPAGLGQDSAAGSSGVALGGPGGGSSVSAGSGFGRSFSGPSIGGAGRGAGRSSFGAGSVTRGQFPAGLGGSSAGFPGSSSTQNDFSSGSSAAGQGFPEGLGGERFRGHLPGAVAVPGQSTPASGSSGYVGSGSGRGSPGLSRSRGKPEASSTAATVLGTLAGVAAAGAIGAGIAAAVQEHGRQNKPGKRGHNRGCRRRCRGRRLCLAFCRRERRSISESKVPAEILDQIQMNFERPY